jgi:ectoine hydroxylase-related dioxygenase (phytanoyl-CoA dioxygenase family)
VDVGPTNGATWLVPGTNHPDQRTSVRSRGAPTTFPDAVQFEASAGDVVVIDPTMWHEMGHDYTETPRWILFAGFCGIDKPAQRNHWQIAGRDLCRDMNEQVRALFLSTDGPDDGSNSAPLCLPDGWPQ